MAGSALSVWLSNGFSTRYTLGMAADTVIYVPVDMLIVDAGMTVHASR